VRYVLEGSVRRLGEMVEVNAQLVSTETGAHVWADRFEGERSKLGELQLDVVSRLANSLGVELVKAEALRAARERPSNPDAVDLAMQAEVKEHSYSSDRKATINEAVALSERALALDPQNVRALTVLANALLDREGDHYSDDPAGDIARAEKAIDATLALQPDSSSAHLAKAISTLRSISGDHRSRRPRRPSPKILTTPRHTRVLALTDCFSAAARRASRASKRRSG